MLLPKLEVLVPVVTPEHGAKFAEGWVPHVVDQGYEAFDFLNLLRFPEEEEKDVVREYHYYALQREIIESVIDSPEVKDAIARVFVRVANEVLDRERRRTV